MTFSRGSPAIRLCSGPSKLVEAMLARAPKERDPQLPYCGRIVTEERIRVFGSYKGELELSVVAYVITKA